MTELINLIRRIGGAWIYIFMVAWAAAILVWYFSSPVDVGYRTEAVVGVDPAASNSNDRIDFARNLQVASTTPSVLETVAAEVGVDPDVIAEGLTISRYGDSNLTRIVYEHADPDPSTAQTVVTDIPEEALAFLRSGALNSLTERVEELEDAQSEALEEAESASRAIEAAISDNSDIPPDVQFGAIQQQLADLRLRRLTLDAAEDPVVAQQIDDAITDLSETFPEVASQAADFRRLQGAADEAEARLDQVEDDLHEARLELRMASVKPEIVVQEVSVPLSRIDTMARNGVAGAILAGLLATFAAVLLVRSRKTEAGVEAQTVSNGKAD